MKLDENLYTDLKNFQRVKSWLSTNQKLQFLKQMTLEKWGISYKTKYEVKRKRKHRAKGFLWEAPAA